MNILFTTKGCSKCQFAKQILEKANIDYIVSTDVNEAKKYGIMSVPTLVMSGELYHFPDIIKLAKGGTENV